MRDRARSSPRLMVVPAITFQSEVKFRTRAPKRGGLFLPISSIGVAHGQFDANVLPIGLLQMSATIPHRGCMTGRGGWEGLPTPAGAEPPNLRSRRTEPLSERVLSVLRVLKAGHELLVSAGVL